MTDALILATVNAPYSQKLDAMMLANCLSDPVVAKYMPGHMSSFFGEVAPSLQIDFAEAYHIPKSKLVEAAKAFAQFSGESYPLAA